MGTKRKLDVKKRKLSPQKVSIMTIEKTVNEKRNIRSTEISRSLQVKKSS